MTDFEFDRDTRVTTTAPNEYGATVTDRWNALGGPNGGYLLATCLQALKQDLPFPDPLAVSAHYLRPASPGAVTIRTEVVRTGRRVATGEARLLQGDREVLRTIASFTDLSKPTGETRMFDQKPSLPPPEQMIDLMAGAPPIPQLSITERVDYRVSGLPGWFQGKPSGVPNMSMWLRLKDGRPADTLALVMLVDAVWPAVMEVGAGASVTVELAVHVRARPAPGWLACRISTRFVSGGFHEEDFEIWDSAGTLVAQSRQLAVLP
jgi:acyl-CoA thioesterase